MVYERRMRDIGFTGALVPLEPAVAAKVEGYVFNRWRRGSMARALPLGPRRCWARPF